MPQIVIDSRPVGDGYPVFVIAEAGTAHQGSLSKAFELIDAAREAGADCVKFQYVIADEIVHPQSGSFPLLGKSVHLYNRFHELEQPLLFYKQLKDYCDQTGILFLCSPFGPESAGNLLSLKPAAMKIASPELNHYPMLKCFRGSRIPLLISTGVSTVKDIKAALKVIDSPFVLLHCITQYPAIPEESNLNTIAFYRNHFHCVAGISDHSEDPLLIPLTSVACGASVIEKHLTLSPSGRGLDDPFALTPSAMTKMISAVRNLEHLPAELRMEKIETEFGKKRIRTIRGRYTKQLSPGEKLIYKTTNRSLIAVRDIFPGEALTEQNCALLRSEHNITPGLPPRYYSSALKKKAAVMIPNGSGILFSMLKTR